jgi:hypothetical protein
MSRNARNGGTLMRWRVYGRWSWRLEWELTRCFVGACVERREGTMAVGYHAWVCVVPMVPLHICLVRWKEGRVDDRG